MLNTWFELVVGVPAIDLGACAAYADRRDHLRIARRADEAGIDSIWTMDHFFQIRISGLPPESPMLEAYTTLAFMVAHTSTIRLGTTVTSVAYRHPAMLVKAVTSLDVLSGGRRLRSGRRGTVEHKCGRGDEQPFEGKHYRMMRPLNSPNSLQRPRPPILVGGSGERKTLRLVARYGDMCNLFDLPGTGFQDNVRRKLDVLRDHCQAVGRDFADIEKTVSTFLDVGDDAGSGMARFVDHLAVLAEIGIEHAIISPRTHGTRRHWICSSIASATSTRSRPRYWPELLTTIRCGGKPATSGRG